jgi:polysaccharide deacetylase family protein (PEP-CTERM system associated)
MSEPRANALTIDLEDYYQVSAFSDLVSPSQWKDNVSRVEDNTDRLLCLFETHGWRATFFTLGWVAKEHPHVVRKVAAAGHEIACHSLLHRRVYEMSPVEFREDTLAAKKLLEDCCGLPVRGYRAPSFSICRGCTWAFDVLAECGFSYDSSIFPVRHPNYGVPEAPLNPFVVQTRSGPLVEFPMTTLAFGGVRSPLAGGAYFRLLPYWFTRWGIRYLNNVEGRAACLYLHPWELDPQQPRLGASLTARLRHYVGIAGAQGKLSRLLADFAFQPMGQLLEAQFPRIKEGAPAHT